MPAALARARLGDPDVGPALVPLLGSPRPSVRAEAARALGDLDQRVALPVLGRLSDSDADPRVRAEAAIACLRLGDGTKRAAVAALLSGETEAARRAALALAAHGDASGLDVLHGLAGDGRADESVRVQAIGALAKLADPRSLPTLVELLQDVRLRSEAAPALAAVGGPQAADALAAALSDERYPEARAAEAKALVALSDRRARGLIGQHLATDSGLPGGVSLLGRLGALGPGSALGFRLAERSAARRGDWRCEARGCWPSVSAAVVLPRAVRGGRLRLVARVTAEAADRQLRIGGRPLPLAMGAQELGVTLEGAGERLPISADPGVFVEALLALAWREDIAPPAPEPWDAGAPDSPRE